MIKNRAVLSSLFVLIVLLSLTGPVRADQPLTPPDGPDSVSLSGDWKYLPFEGGFDLSDPKFDDSEWQTMTLPSNWFLRGNKVYPTGADLSPAPKGAVGNWGESGQKQPERGLDYSGTIWFRRHFQYQPARPGAPIILHFDMVDYFADVYLNGHLVGRHEGYFQPFEFDVSRWLSSGDNVLAVKVGAPALPFDWTEEYPISWPKRQAFIKGIFAYHDTRPGGTTVRGQERGTGGILGDINLRTSPGVDIIRAEVAPLEVSEKSARLRIDYLLQNWTGQEQSGTLRGRITPKNFSGNQEESFEQKVQLKPGENRVRVTRKVESPVLWWSWDYGKPNLYQLDTTLAGGLSGRYNTPFGIRSIRHDSNWVWYLNGTRIFPRGSNYISTQWLSQTDRAWYERDVKMMIGANLNSMRIHAHLEKPEFYQVADEMGVMIWQDFPLQWGYTDVPAFHQDALKQLGDMESVYFNHPSIIVWCLHNESPHAMSWMKRKVQDQNKDLDNALLKESQELDPTRVSHRDSGTGDGHTYDGWYSGKASGYASIPAAPFITEYGAEALPDLETLKTMFPPEVLWPRTPADWETWAYHNFQSEQTFNLAKVPMGNNIEEFVHNSQNYQGALLRFSTENFRRAKWAKTTGIYQFMFVEDWPSITWAVVDYYRRPKRGYFTLRDAMQPVLPSIEYMIDDPAKPLVLWVVNDKHQGYKNARMRWSHAGQQDSKIIDVPADGVVKVVSLGDARTIAGGTGKLEVWLEDEKGQALGHNTLEAADFINWKQ